MYNKKKSTICAQIVDFFFHPVGAIDNRPYGVYVLHLMVILLPHFYKMDNSNRHKKRHYLSFFRQYSHRISYK